jgi:hypothetical protein
MRSLALLSLLLSPTLAFADGPPEAYLQGLWRAKKDTATAGAVVAGIGITATGAGIALQGQPDIPTELLVVSGALGTASGVTVMSIAGLSARYDPLNQTNAPTGAYLALALVGASGVGLATLAVTENPETHDALLYGSAGVAASAIIPAMFQLSSNAAAWNDRKASVSWAPIASPSHAGGAVSIRF